MMRTLPRRKFRSHGALLEQGGLPPGSNRVCAFAITCGSRQIANLVAITKAIVSFVRKKGGSPFVVASMGSHGGATSEGQKDTAGPWGYGGVGGLSD